MALSTFAEKERQPTSATLRAALGEASAVWKALIAETDRRFGPLTVEWGFSSKKTGWGVRLKTPARTLLYLKPCEGHFLASFVLGEKAVAAAHEAGLPAAILAAIDAAPRYAEGRGVRLEVRRAEDLPSLLALTAIKAARCGPPAPSRRRVRV